MIKILAIIVHNVAPTYFENKSYSTLSKWGIEDVHKRKLYFLQKAGKSRKNGEV
tara:strand:- start:675 stop:836 length:162 start_codon:yes stop_codon:yes gene_type:complete